MVIFEILFQVKKTVQANLKEGFALLEFLGFTMMQLKVNVNCSFTEDVEATETITTLQLNALKLAGKTGYRLHLN